MSIYTELKKELKTILKNAGYEGYVSVEFEGLENCLDGIEIGFANLKKMTEML